MSDPSAHRVYEADAVDRYITELHQEIDELKQGGSPDEAWRTAEATLGRAMLSAQREADATLAEAAEKARLIVAEAQMEADRLLADAERRVNEATRAVADAERQAEELRRSIDVRGNEPTAATPVLTAFAPPRAAERVAQYVPDGQANHWAPPADDGPG